MSRRTSLLAVFLGALVAVSVASQPYSEVPFTVLVYAGLLITLRALRRTTLPMGHATAIGIFFGLAALMRPAALLVWLPVVAVVALLRAHSGVDRLRFAAILGAVFVATLAPWQLVLMAKTESAAPLSTGGPDAMTAGLMLNHRPDEEGTAWVPERVDSLFAEVAANEPDIDDSTGEVVRFVGERVAEDPLMGAQLVALKAARSWFGTDSLNNETLVLLLQVAYLTVAVAGIVIALRSRLAPPAAVALVLATISYFWAVTIVVASIVRYLSPVAGLLTPFVALALFALPGLRRFVDDTDNRLQTRNVTDRSAI